MMLRRFDKIDRELASEGGESSDHPSHHLDLDSSILQPIYSIFLRTKRLVLLRIHLFLILGEHHCHFLSVSLVVSVIH